MRSSSSFAETPAASGSGRHYLGLDLIRGIAALAVLFYHIDFMFGLRGSLLTAGYLAVDLFFILSGFVIACNYESRVARGAIGPRVFATRRIARLYPLYALMLVAGLFIMTTRYATQNGYLDTGRLVISAALNVFLIPSVAGAYGSDILFPFNAASWSIFYEAVINVAFFVLLAPIATRPLVTLWVLSGIALAVVAWQIGNLDVGWALRNFVAGFARVAFSFVTGMLIWRYHGLRSWRSPGWVFAMLLAATLALMQGHDLIPVAWHGLADLVAVMGLLPALVVSGVGVSLSRFWATIAKYLGNISYAVYLTQGPLIIAAAGVTQKLLGAKIYDLAPVAGFVFVPVCIALSTLCYRRFEMPARALFRERTHNPPDAVVRPYET